MTSAGFGSIPSCQGEKSVKTGGKTAENQQGNKRSRKKKYWREKEKKPERVKGRVPREKRQRRVIVYTTKTETERSEEKK